MQHLRIAEQALRVAAEPASQRYVCRSCLAHAVRQLHTTRTHRAEVPFYKKVTTMLFGDKKADEKKVKRKQGTEASAVKAQSSTTGTSKRMQKKEINGVTYWRARRLNPTVHKDYLPATTWDGLERVGGEQWAKKQLDKGEQYTGFVPHTKAELTNSQWQRLLHNIVVEIATLQKAGRSAMEVCNAHTHGSSIEQTINARLSQAEDGTLQVQFSSPEDEAFVLAGIEAKEPSRTSQNSEKTADLDKMKIKPENLRAQLAQITRSGIEVNWSNITFDDPEVKLAVLKRSMQLSGKRIPDIQMNNSRSLDDLYEALKAKEKPKKLAQAPQVEELARSLPNVRVHKTRRTPVHKEKEIGRWKIIEEQLSLRDLPIFGSRWRNGREGLRLHEK